jgi:hypothetical protein
MWRKTYPRSLSREHATWYGAGPYLQSLHVPDTLCMCVNTAICKKKSTFFHQQKGKGKGTRGWHGAQPRPASTRRFPGAGGAADSLHSVIASPGTSGVDIRSRDRAFDLTSIACAVGERATQPTACSTH